MAKNPAWSVKGVDDQTRAVARAAAARAGLPIGVWIDRAILAAASPTQGVPAAPPAADVTATAVEIPADDAAAPAAAPDGGKDYRRPEKSPLDVPPPSEERTAPADRRAAAGPGRGEALRYGVGGALVLVLVAAGFWAAERIDMKSGPPSPPRETVTAADTTSAATPKAGEPATPAAGPQAVADQPAPAGAPATPVAPKPAAAPHETVASLAAVTAEAAAGNAKAQYEIGVRYSLGKDVPKDERRAAEWIEKAAFGGLAAAQFNLAALYEHGRGVALDDKLAFFWYQSAAEQNYPRALHNLGTFYAVGNGTPQNYQEAARWFDRAAKAGVTESLYSLGLIYEHGLGVPRNQTIALDYYRRAAAAGNADARSKLAAARPVIAPDSAATGNGSAAASLSAIAPAAGTGRNEPAGDTRPLTRREMAELQRLLARLDFAPGSADGVAGRRTRTAIRLYQEFAGLPADGKATRQLLEDVRAVVGGLGGKGAKAGR